MAQRIEERSYPTYVPTTYGPRQEQHFVMGMDEDEFMELKRERDEAVEAVYRRRAEAVLSTEATTVVDFGNKLQRPQLESQA